MNTLILYTTKSGASQYCAELLVEKMENSIAYDLSKESPDISSFQTVVIGSGVRMGKFYKPIRNFIKKNESVLVSKKIAFYLCNAYPDTTQKAITKNIPKKLIERSVSIKSFGGKQPFNSSGNTDWILIENVNIFISEIESF